MNAIKAAACVVVSLLSGTMVAQTSSSSNTLTGTSPNPTEFLGSDNNYDVIFKANNTERMRILSSTGYVGIGTSNAQQPFHVVGKSRFDIPVGSTGAGGGRLYLTRPAVANYENLISFGTNGTSTYEWVLGTANGQSDFGIYNWTYGRLFTVTTAGGVCVGSPSIALAKLHVGGDLIVTSSTSGVTSAGYIRNNSAYSGLSNPDFTWYTDYNTGLFHPNPDIIGVVTNGVEAMRVNSNGNIGIGTTDPGTTGPNSKLIISSNGTDNIKFYGNATGDIQGSGSFSPHFGTGNTFNIYEGTVGSGTLRFQVAAGGTTYLAPVAGNVGIGTTNATAKLTVNGSVLIGDPSITLPVNYKLYVQTGILTEKVKVALTTTSDWADYVFESNYQLRSLDEVKNFISENKHLPGVPSAKELQEQGGIDLGKMDAKLMEKIEELTLYLLEMKQENKALTERIAKLEASK